MNETIFNLYYFCNNGIITQLGAAPYDVPGNDGDKTDFLRSHAKEDYIRCEVFNVSDKMEKISTTDSKAI